MLLNASGLSRITVMLVIILAKADQQASCWVAAVCCTYIFVAGKDYCWEPSIENSTRVPLRNIYSMSDLRLERSQTWYEIAPVRGLLIIYRECPVASMCVFTLVGRPYFFNCFFQIFYGEINKSGNALLLIWKIFLWLTSFITLADMMNLVFSFSDNREFSRLYIIPWNICFIIPTKLREKNLIRSLWILILLLVLMLQLN